MKYARHENAHKLDSTEKRILLEEYVNHYEKMMKEQGIKVLNAKIPREIFDSILDEVGCFLQQHAASLLKENREVQDFLRNNPLPQHMTGLLPDDFRVFSLLLNALKQWVTAESAATDRFLLGGTAREICRKAVTHCIVTGDALSEDAELHHPVRDGRPPIYLSKKGHKIVEGGKLPSPNSIEGEDPLWEKVKFLRSQRNQSWAQLREGCNMLLTQGTCGRPGAKSFANMVMRQTGINPREILRLLDSRGL